MPAKHIGIDSQLYEQPEFVISIDEKGVWTLKCTYECREDLAVRLTPKPQSAHRQYPFLLLNKATLSRTEGGMMRIDCEYVGLSPEYQAGESSAVVYELSGGTSEEPIETHPRYADIPEAELDIIRHYFDNPKKDGAQPTGLGALATELFQKKKRGIESYLAPGFTFRKTWSQKTPLAAVGNIGKISTPDGPAPTLNAGYNWLLIDAGSKQVGGTHDCFQEWRVSGPGGWDTELYQA